MPPPLMNNFPPIIGVRWFNLSVLIVTPVVAGYGLFVAPLLRGTALFAMLYYVFSMLGELLVNVA
jgi:stearoyl-CoA desaturase (delta-9 desaturase)